MRFTTRGSTVGAILLGWPDNGEAVTRSLGVELRLFAAAVGDVKLRGCHDKLQ